MQKKVKPHGVPKLGLYNSLDKTWWGGCLIVCLLFQIVITNVTPLLDIILMLIQIVGRAEGWKCL